MKVSSLLQSYNMLNVIDFPTTISDGSVSAVDSIFVNGSRVSLFTIAPSSVLSDHEVQYRF